MNLKILPDPKSIFSHISSSSDLPYYFKIYLMRGNTLLLSDYFDLYYDTDSSEQWSRSIMTSNLQTKKLDLPRSQRQELAGNEVHRFFTAKTHVSPPEIDSFIQFWGLLFINEEERKG